jgi:hypothetical protein
LVNRGTNTVAAAATPRTSNKPAVFLSTLITLFQLWLLDHPHIARRALQRGPNSRRTQISIEAQSGFLIRINTLSYQSLIVSITLKNKTRKFCHFVLGYRNMHHLGSANSLISLTYW